ncbi:MAG: hypothetical protein DCF17_06315 [Shackletoniella antarctica]|uniref:HEAT repeat domain-containing protein n=1 Tax=Shackletoniella antarctica TaxID=268115 RepID=A0A2W4WML6_9CYAN|nr:MAG: hypothetical protein DCF17_06315 [Shackletoniella antarctica]
MGYAALALAAGLLDLGSGLFSRAVAASPLTIHLLAAPVLDQPAQVAAPANPVLLQPRAEGNEVTISQAAPSPAEPTEASSEALAEEDAPENDIPESDIPENDTAAPDGDLPPSGERRLGWWLVGSLALATSLGGWLLLGRGKQRSRADGLASAPAADVPPSPSQTEGAAAALADTNALVATEPPLESTIRLSSVDLVDSLVNQLASTDAASRRHAIWELGQRGNSDAIQPLVNGLLQGDSQEKSLILAALAEISSRSLKPMHRALALGLQDPSPEVRKNAIRDLSRVYDTVVQLSHMLAHASQDPDPGVQETAQWALSQLNRIPAAPYPSKPAALETSYDGEGHRLPPS